MAEVWTMAKINNFDEANDELLNVENLHYNWIVTRQLVAGHQLRQESTIVYFVDEYGSLV